MFFFLLLPLHSLLIFHSTKIYLLVPTCSCVECLNLFQSTPAQLLSLRQTIISSRFHLKHEQWLVSAFSLSIRLELLIRCDVFFLKSRFVAFCELLKSAYILERGETSVAARRRRWSVEGITKKSAICWLRQESVKVFRWKVSETRDSWKISASNVLCNEKIQHDGIFIECKMDIKI